MYTAPNARTLRGILLEMYSLHPPKIDIPSRDAQNTVINGMIAAPQIALIDAAIRRTVIFVHNLNGRGRGGGARVKVRQDEPANMQILTPMTNIPLCQTLTNTNEWTDGRHGISKRPSSLADLSLNLITSRRLSSIFSALLQTESRAF